MYWLVVSVSIVNWYFLCVEGFPGISFADVLAGLSFVWTGVYFLVQCSVPLYSVLVVFGVRKAE